MPASHKNKATEWEGWMGGMDGWIDRWMDQRRRKRDKLCRRMILWGSASCRVQYGNTRAESQNGKKAWLLLLLGCGNREVVSPGWEMLCRPEKSRSNYK